MVSSSVTILLLSFISVVAINEGSYPSLRKTQIETKYPVIPHEYIVVFKAGHADEHIQKHLSFVRAHPDATVHREWLIEADDATKSFRGYHMSVNDDKLAALRAKFGEEVAFVEQNGEVLPDEGFLRSAPPRTECKMQASATWGITRTATLQNDKNSFYSYESGSKSSNVNVYVIDTGIRTTHEEFEGRAVFGADMWHTPPLKTDERGHGTHVAGTIGGRLYGVAKDVNLISVNVFPTSGSGTKAVTISGIEWAANDAKSSGKRSLINMSLGGSKDEAQNAAVDAASAAGVPCIISSGMITSPSYTHT
jgi:subtilisin family serine protease